MPYGDTIAPKGPMAAAWGPIWSKAPSAVAYMGPGAPPVGSNAAGWKMWCGGGPAYTMVASGGPGAGA